MYDLSRLSCLGEALLDATVTYKSSTALVEADRGREKWRKSYAELRDEARGVAAGLARAGFEAGDRCAILMSNQSRWLVSATGALWAGATLIPLDYKLTAPEQAALLRHAKPRVLITELSVWHKLQHETLPPGVLVYVSEAPESTAWRAGVESWDGALGGPAGEPVYRPRARADVACIVYSSGTGGVPKGCQLTHGNYLAQAEVLGQL